MVYFFHYVVPQRDHALLLNTVMTRDLPTAMQTCKNARLKSPLWSSDFVENGMFQLRQDDANICKGHNYQVALIWDRILDGGISKIIANHDLTHYLTDSELSDFFTSNQYKCFWDTSGVTVVNAGENP